ncbi:unnamed protein product [Caenorhabditis auriculariae]|uniref:Uncharacterized protein n=1 Tax=Caenorhabditis auriculariae TaxID=2777116 RepID=A0A8S1GUG7_9PELO|nr:unnamed protein product [Caenorhabditis auriculariae]
MPVDATVNKCSNGLATKTTIALLDSPSNKTVKWRRMSLGLSWFRRRFSYHDEGLLAVCADDSEPGIRLQVDFERPNGGPRGMARRVAAAERPTATLRATTISY